jgi:hypothetical protein
MRLDCHSTECDGLRNDDALPEEKSDSDERVECCKGLDEPCSLADCVSKSRGGLEDACLPLDERRRTQGHDDFRLMR